MEHTRIPREVYLEMVPLTEGHTRDLIKYIAANWGTGYAEFHFQLNRCKVTVKEIGTSAHVSALTQQAICHN